MKISLVSGSLPPHDVCGVGDYTRKMFDQLKDRISVDLRHIPIRKWYEPDLFKVFEDRDLVHIQYPTEGWGKSLLPSILPAYKGRSKLLLTLHEWSQMNPIRRASIRPLVASADGYIFVSPREREAFWDSAPKPIRDRPSWVVPIGVNLDTPYLSEDDLREYRPRLLGGAAFAITHFGFIHAGKQPQKLLDALAQLRSDGLDTKIVFVGGFKSDQKAESEAFYSEVERRKLDRCVEFRGFVEDEREAALILGSGDVNVSLFSDGLSSRRGSFWYAAQHGVPLVTTAPQDWREFAKVEPLLTPPHVWFVPTEATGQEVAKVVRSVPCWRPRHFAPIPVEDWADIAAEHERIYRILLL